MSFFNELKRRNVLRVAAGYVVVAWLVVQVVETIFPQFGFEGAIRIVIIGLAIGFLPVVVSAWAFEWTPQGLRKESDVEQDQPVRVLAGKRYDRVVMVILALAVAIFVFREVETPPPLSTPTIAVLPFVNMTSDPEQAYFGVGIAEEVLNLLARIPQLHVTSRTSSFEFSDQGLDTQAIAKKLNVAHILEGSVRKAGNEIRVTAQLIDSRSDKHLWSETYDRTLDDIFAIQDEIAENIVENLHVEMIGPMPKATRTDPVVLAMTVQARQIFYDSFLTSFSGGAGDRMAALLDRALEIDPEYTPAMAWYAYANFLRRQEDLISPEEEMRLFDELAERALAIDPEQATILQLQAWNEIFIYQDTAAAAPLYERALRSAPNNSEVLRQVGRFAYAIERHDEASELIERAVALDPLCTSCLYYLSRAYMIAGRLQEAEEARSRFLLIGGGGGYYFYGIIKLLQGDAAAALQVFDDHLNGDDYDGSQHSAASAMALHSLGRHEESDAMLATLVENWGDREQDMVAQVFAWRDEKDSAFKWLHLALDADIESRFRGPRRVTRLGDPVFRNLHDDPRWDDFRRRTGLPAEVIAAVNIDLTIPGNP